MCGRRVDWNHLRGGRGEVSSGVRVEIVEELQTLRSWESLAGMNLGAGVYHSPRRELSAVASFALALHFWDSETALCASSAKRVLR